MDGRPPGNTGCCRLLPPSPFTAAAANPPDRRRGSIPNTSCRLPLCSRPPGRRIHRPSAGPLPGPATSQPGPQAQARRPALPPSLSSSGPQGGSRGPPSPGPRRPPPSLHRPWGAGGGAFSSQGHARPWHRGPEPRGRPSVFLHLGPETPTWPGPRSRVSAPLTRPTPPEGLSLRWPQAQRQSRTPSPLRAARTLQNRRPQGEKHAGTPTHAMRVPAGSDSPTPTPPHPPLAGGTLGRALSTRGTPETGGLPWGATVTANARTLPPQPTPASIRHDHPPV